MPPPGTDADGAAHAGRADRGARAARPRCSGRSTTRCRPSPVPIAGDITYRFDRDGIDIGPSRFATPSTYVEFEGRTAYGDNSRMPFHVSSADWQESDRLFAGRDDRVRQLAPTRFRSAATARSTA